MISLKRGKKNLLSDRWTVSLQYYKSGIDAASKQNIDPGIHPNQGVDYMILPEKNSLVKENDDQTNVALASRENVPGSPKEKVDVDQIIRDLYGEDPNEA